MKLEQLLKELGPRKPFRPSWFFNREGDSIEMMFKDVPYYAEWLNHDVTLFKAIGTDEIVGCALYGVREEVTFLGVP